MDTNAVAHDFAALCIAGKFDDSRFASEDFLDRCHCSAGVIAKNQVKHFGLNSTREKMEKGSI